MREFRERSGLSLEKVGAVLGWSPNTMSRFERGLRPDTAPEELSALLAAIGVLGPDRERLMQMVRSQDAHGWWEARNDNPIYFRFEARAKRIVNVEPMAVPGLLQIPDYTRALMIAFGMPEEMIIRRVARRLLRQELLVRPNPPDLTFIVCEGALRVPVGGHAVSARQIRRMVVESQRPHVHLHVLPTEVGAHPGMRGAFAVIEFADESPVVYLEGRHSAMFPEDLDEIANIRMDAERQLGLSLGEQDSRDLLSAIAKDHEQLHLVGELR